MGTEINTRNQCRILSGARLSIYKVCFALYNNYGRIMGDGVGKCATVKVS